MSNKINETVKELFSSFKSQIDAHKDLNLILKPEISCGLKGYNKFLVKGVYEKNDSLHAIGYPFSNEDNYVDLKPVNILLSKNQVSELKNKTFVSMYVNTIKIREDSEKSLTQVSYF